MRYYRTMSNENKLSLKDKVALVAAVIAVFTSVLALGRDYIFGQHVLRASVVRVDEAEGKLRADILLVNSGNITRRFMRRGHILGRPFPWRRLS